MTVLRGADAPPAGTLAAVWQRATPSQRSAAPRADPWVELNDGTDVPYDATVQYSYVPTAHVLDGVIRSGTKNSGSDWRVQFIWPELTGTLSPTLLHGFRVHYTDDVARPLGRLQIGMGGRKATIYFHDLSGDDAFDGSIDIIATNY